MLRDITLGQYYPADSLIHRLDPRVKLLATLCCMIFLFLNDFVSGYVLNVLILFVLVRLSRVPVRQLVKGLKSILFLLLLSIFFTVLFTSGEDIIFQMGVINITWQGIWLALKICIRIFLLIIMSTMLTLTTTPTDIADGIEKAFRPLNKIGVPIHEIAMMLTIALRFIPVLMEETDKIMRAQKARGADFERGSLIQRAKGLVPIFIPLIVSSVKRSMDLAMAMEARCYHGGQGRTKMKPLVYGRRDRIAYVVLLVYSIGMLVLKIFHG